MKKKVWHCTHCHCPCEIFKKGKGHRVLVCPHCGIIATNPLPLLAGAVGIAKGAAKFVKSGIKGLTSSPVQQELQSAGYPSRPVVVRQPVLVDID